MPKEHVKNQTVINSAKYGISTYIQCIEGGLLTKGAVVLLADDQGANDKVATTGG